MKAEAFDALPRNRRQAEYCRSVWKAKDLHHVSCVQHHNWQLGDLKRFWASNKLGVSIMSVDPTFDFRD